MAGNVASHAAMLVLCSALAGCVPLSAPIFQPQTVPIAHVGVVLWPGGPMDAFPNASVFRVPVHSRAQADAILAQAQPPQSVLLLVERDDDALVRSLANLDHPSLAGIELGNELDLAGLTPFQFGNWNVAMYAVLRGAGWSKPILAGSVYAVTDDTVNYLRTSRRWVQWPSDLVTTVHWYQDAEDTTLAALQRLGPIAVTETGMPSRTANDDAAQLAYLQHMKVRAQQLGAAWWIVYQCCSGPSSSNLDNFGLLRVDGSAKPGLAVISGTP